MYKLCVYIPEDALEAVKSSMFAAGAGKIGEYEQCCWQSIGEGQFLPLSRSQPAIGSVGEIEKVAEYKVELVCESDKLEGVIAALKSAHPYEEPAFQYWRVNS